MAVVFNNNNNGSELHNYNAGGSASVSGAMSVTAGGSNLGAFCLVGMNTGTSTIGFDLAVNTGSSSSTTLNITPSASGNAIFVFVQTAGTLPTGLSDNVNTGAYTQVSSFIHEGASTQIYYSWWYHLNCASSLTTITSAGSATATGMIAYSLSNVSSTNTIANSETGNGTTTSLSTTSLSASTVGGMLLAGFGDGDATVTQVNPYITAGTGWTTSTNENCFFVPAGCQHQSVTTPGVQTVLATATTSSPHWGAVSISINPVTPSISTITYGGVNMTPVAPIFFNPNTVNQGVQAFYLTTTGGLLTGSNTLAITGNVQVYEIIANLVSFTGVNQSTPVAVGSFQSTSGSNNTATLNITSSSTQLTETIFCTAATIASGNTNQTYDTAYNGTEVDIGIDHATTAGATITDTWTTSGSGNYAFIGYSIGDAPVVSVVYFLGHI